MSEAGPLQHSKTKSQFRIGSIHGRVNYSQDERVFHLSEASPETRATVNLVKSALTAGRVHGGMYRITEARERPQYISNKDTANYAVASSDPHSSLVPLAGVGAPAHTHSVVGSVLTSAPNPTHSDLRAVGIVRDMVFNGSTGTGSLQPAWVGEDDRARAQLARLKLLEGQQQQRERQRAEVLAAVRAGKRGAGVATTSTNTAMSAGTGACVSGGTREWCSSVLLGKERQELRGKKRDISDFSGSGGAGHVSVVERERRHMARLRAARDEQRHSVWRRAKEAEIEAHTRARRWAEARRAEDELVQRERERRGWGRAAGAGVGDSLQRCVEEWERRREREAGAADMGVMRTTMRASAGASATTARSLSAGSGTSTGTGADIGTGGRVRYGCTVAGVAPFLKTVNRSDQYVQPRPVSTYARTHTPLYRVVQYPDERDDDEDEGEREKEKEEKEEKEGRGGEDSQGL